MGSKPFDVIEQVSGRVDRKICVNFAGVRPAPTAATLIEQNHPVSKGIEEAAHAGAASATEIACTEKPVATRAG
jgi:hypothetical protein